MRNTLFQMEYPKDNFIQLLKVMHQELMQLKLTSYQNITEEMLQQLGHMERTFIALSHCVGKTPEWQNRSHEHERFDLEKEDYWRIKTSAQAELFSARWCVVADILGEHTDMDVQVNILDSALVINDEIQRTLLNAWPEEQLPLNTIFFRDDAAWQEQIESHRSVIEEYRWKLSSSDDRAYVKNLIISTMNSTHERELRLLLLCIGVQFLNGQSAKFAPFNMSLCYRPPEPHLFEMINRTYDAPLADVHDINSFKTKVSAERRRKNGCVSTYAISVGRTIDKIVDAFEETDSCCVCILHVEKHRINALATVISECLHLPMTSVKRVLKHSYPAVVTCKSNEQASDLKKKISELCVCC